MSSNGSNELLMSADFIDNSEPKQKILLHDFYTRIIKEETKHSRCKTRQRKSETKG